jgi:hypothetical protein
MVSGGRRGNVVTVTTFWVENKYAALQGKLINVSHHFGRKNKERVNKQSSPIPPPNQIAEPIHPLSTIPVAFVFHPSAPSASASIPMAL